jgi:hypothetical protein
MLNHFIGYICLLAMLYGFVSFFCWLYEKIKSAIKYFTKLNNFINKQDKH